MDLTKIGSNLSVWFGNDDTTYLYEREAITCDIIRKFNLLDTNGLDIGCGKRKSLPTAIGIDLVRGFSEKNCKKRSFIDPEIVCNGEQLIFKDETIDWITSAHNIEHYKNPVGVLNEWLRVLKVGGLISLIIPRPEYCGKIGDPDTDLNHEHDFTVASFKKDVINKLGHIKIIKLENLPNKWSFICVIEKTK